MKSSVHTSYTHMSMTNWIKFCVHSNIIISLALVFFAISCPQQLYKPKIVWILTFSQKKYIMVLLNGNERGSWV